MTRHLLYHAHLYHGANVAMTVANRRHDVTRQEEAGDRKSATGAPRITPHLPEEDRMVLAEDRTGRGPTQTVRVASSVRVTV